jgi:hypothetical protein
MQESHVHCIVISTQKQRYLIANGMIAFVTKTDQYGRWMYTTTDGRTFMSTISPVENHLRPGHTN